MSTTAEYVNAQPDDVVSVVVVVEVDNLTGHMRGDQFDYTGPKRWVRRLEWAGAVTVRGVPKKKAAAKKPRKKAGS